MTKRLNSKAETSAFTTKDTASSIRACQQKGPINYKACTSQLPLIMLVWQHCWAPAVLLLLLLPPPAA
jgi:hypothetical protein